MRRVILYWRDIPAQVIVREGRQSAKRELPKRFITAIDSCAMRSGVTGTDAYLEEWRKGPAEEIESNDLEKEAEHTLSMIDTSYSNERLKKLVDNSGFEPSS